MTREQTLEFENGFVLKFSCRGERFLGIGEVLYDGTALRNPTLPWTVYTESDDGYRFEDFRLKGVEATAAEATIRFSAEAVWMPRVKTPDAMGDARIRTRRLKAPTAEFRWTFRAITETVWDNDWTGLAMSLEVDCPDHPTNWVLEDTTWEIGGEAAGATLIQQDMSSIDLEQSVEADSVFSTIERFYNNDEPHIPDADAISEGNLPIDMMPRGGGSAPLDFQVKGDLAMCLFAEKPDLTRARTEKFRGENVIHYLDRPVFPLTDQPRPPERKLLVYRHPAPLKRHEWRNLWLDAFTEVRRRGHESYGFTLNIPRPIVWAFMWNYDLAVHGPDWVDPLIAALPEYKRLGYTDVFTHGAFEGTTNDPATAPGNVCLNYDYTYCAEYGGPAAMKRLFDAAHDLGMTTWQWFGFYYDNRSPHFKEHPEWLEHDAGGHAYGGAGRMRSGFRDHLMERIKTIREQTGLDGVFWDSYQNTGLTNIEWNAPDKAPHAEEIWRFQAELQGLGLQQRCETVTTFGVSTIGMYGIENDKTGWAFRRRPWENLFANDEAFAWLDCSPTIFTENTFSAEKLSPKIYFWLMGHRCVPTHDGFPWGPEHKGRRVPSGGPRLPGGDLAAEYAAANHQYNAALPHMHRLRVTKGGQYTLWLDENNEPAVIWAFEDARADYSGEVTDLADRQTSAADGSLALTAGHVYLLGDRQAAEPA